MLISEQGKDDAPRFDRGVQGNIKVGRSVIDQRLDTGEVALDPAVKQRDVILMFNRSVVIHEHRESTK